MYEQDNTLREKIRSFLQEKITESQGDALPFVLGKDFKQVNPGEDQKPFVQVKTLENTYTTIDETFTLAMISDFRGSPEPIKDLLVITYTLPVVFFVSVRESFKETKEAMEAFVNSLRGEDFIVDTYLFGTNAEEITNTENIVDLNGKEYVRFTTTIYISATEDGLIGNYVKTFFGETEQSSVRIYPVSRNTARSFSEDGTNWNIDKQTFTMIEESTWSTNLSFFINKNNTACIPLIQHLEEPEQLNKVWYYNKDYGVNFGGSFAKEVVITELAVTDEIGEFAVITFTLKLSGVNYGQ